MKPRDPERKPTERPIHDPSQVTPKNPGYDENADSDKRSPFQEDPPLK